MHLRRDSKQPFTPNLQRQIQNLGWRQASQTNHHYRAPWEEWPHFRGTQQTLFAAQNITCGVKEEHSGLDENQASRERETKRTDGHLRQTRQLRIERWSGWLPVAKDRFAAACRGRNSELHVERGRTRSVGPGRGEKERKAR
jgi:hypothetical protein